MGQSKNTKKFCFRENTTKIDKMVVFTIKTIFTGKVLSNEFTKIMMHGMVLSNFLSEQACFIQLRHGATTGISKGNYKNVSIPRWKMRKQIPFHCRKCVCITCDMHQPIYSMHFQGDSMGHCGCTHLTTYSHIIRHQQQSAKGFHMQVHGHFIQYYESIRKYIRIIKTLLKSLNFAKIHHFLRWRKQLCQSCKCLF